MSTEDLYNQITEYGDLLKKYFDRQLSAEERSRLARWLWSDRKNRDFFRRLGSEQSLKTYYDFWQQVNPTAEYELLKKRIMPSRTRRVGLPLVWRWAAVVVLLIGSSAAWYFFRTPESVQMAVQLAGERSVAILRTSDGGVFHLDGQRKEIAGLQAEGIQVYDSLKELVCRQLPTEDTLSYHELDIPRGGEYKLVLADGTKVWLNSESSIRFPGAFGGRSREITVTGEVYLEVARDEGRPFRVRAGEGKVEVLGTAFGIQVYPEEKVWSATLVHGSVKASFGTSSMVLTPGHKAYMEGGKLLNKEVNTDHELDWVRGIFVFEHEQLGDVVRKLSRWYNTEFRFERESLKEYLFTGQVSRDLGVENILDLIERMNVVCFEKKADYILIKEKAGKY